MNLFAKAGGGKNGIPASAIAQIAGHPDECRRVAEIVEGYLGRSDLYRAKHKAWEEGVKTDPS